MTMAAEDDKTTVEVGETTTTEAASGKGSKKLIMFGGIGVGVVVIGVALALFVIKPMMSGSSDSPEATDKTEQAESHAEKPKPKKHDSHGGEATSMIYAVKDIVVNPAGTGGTRFLSVSFGFELGSSELVSEFEERDPLVRDALITILSSKTVAQLTDPKQKEITRYQVKKRLEKLLDTDEITGVYYTDFVLQ